MKRKILLGTLLTLILVTLTVVMAIAPTLAVPEPNKSKVKFFYSVGAVVLQLPTPSNAISPPAAPGTPSHPASLKLIAFDNERKSTFGAQDWLAVALWVPQGNAYVPVAVISDSNDEGQAFFKTLYTNTFIWRANFENVIAVEDKDLDVWTESSETCYEKSYNGWGYEGNTAFIVSLTKAVTIKLPFSTWGDQTFTLPPMTLTFREIGNPYYVEETSTLARPPYSGYTENVKIWRSPAYVACSIPAWIIFSDLQFVGNWGTRGTLTYTPPS